MPAEIKLRQQQYEYYRDKLLDFSNIWERERVIRIIDKILRKLDTVESNKYAEIFERMLNKVEYIELWKIWKVCMCKRIMKDQTSSEGEIPFYKIWTFWWEADAFITSEIWEEYTKKYSYPKKWDILISAAWTIWKTVIFDWTPSYFQDSNIVRIMNDETKALNKYLYYIYKTNPRNVSDWWTIARLYNDNIAKAKIPIPSLEEQERIVNILDKFEKLVNDISEWLPAEIELRKKQYEYYRDKLLTFN